MERIGVEIGGALYEGLLNFILYALLRVARLDTDEKAWSFTGQHVSGKYDTGRIIPIIPET